MVAKLEAALMEVLALPDLRKRLTEMGAVVTALNGKDFAAFIQAETKKWADVIAQNNIKF